MKKLLFILTFAACGKTNPAEVMIHAQVPDAKCVSYGTRDGISITRCVIKGEKDTVSIIGAYSVAHPFQTWVLKTADQIKKEQQAQQAAQAAQTPPAAPAPAPVTPDAGVDAAAGEGSGSHASK